MGRIPKAISHKFSRGGARLADILRLGAAAALLWACAVPMVSPSGGPPSKASPSPSSSSTPRLSTPIPTPTILPTSTPRPRSERVLIVSLDGLRPDALDPNRTPAILALAESGAFTLTAQTIDPSVTLPAHGSMLSGYDVERHGLTWNDYLPDNGFILTPTLFSLAHDAGLHTEMVVSKEKLVHIASPGSVDEFTYVPGGDFAVAEQAGIAIADGFEVLFVHFPGPDTAGHQDGWTSPTYLGTVAHSDEAVARILADLEAAGLREGTLIILTSDHGGHGEVHGSSLPEDMTIPWIVAGPGVVAGTRLTSPITVYDTAATALWALGLSLPADIAGRPVVEAFAEGSAREWTIPPALASAPKVPFPAPGAGGRVETLGPEVDARAGSRAVG
ncbi:MAG: Sulfatase protein [Anaerolineales bacterium]|nr:Sulfatase protein [Anaerolineales bacterium]